MKKLILVTGALCYSFFMHGQNVGIGTNTPREKLEIKNALRSTLKISSNSFNDTTQLMFSNRSGLQGTDFLITAKREEGLFISSKSDFPENTNDSLFTILTNGLVGMGTKSPAAKLHINGNTIITGFNSLEFGRGVTKEINAGKIGYQTFSPDALDIVGAGTTTNNRKIHFFSEGGAEFDGPVNVNSAIQVNGNAGNPGQVLMSNGATGSSWQSISQNPAIGFNAEGTSAQPVSPLITGIRLHFNTVNFNDGANYNPGTGAFVAPVSGVYHFDAKVSFFDADPGNYRLFLDNNTSFADGEYARTYQQASVIGTISLNLSITLKLTAGQPVLAHVWHNATTDQSAVFTYFSGHRLY